MKKIILLITLFFSIISLSQITSTSFEEPELFNGHYTDTGDPGLTHDLVNNTNEPLVNYNTTGGELGFNATYVPYEVPGVGLTDGDLAGVTDDPPNSSNPFSNGSKGYIISDVDGNFILEFDPVDLTGVSSPTLTLDYFLNETSYEGDGTLNESASDRLRIYVKDHTNSSEIDILDTTGSDINDLLIEGTWITGTATLLANTTVQLVIEARTNAGTEAFYFDNIVFNGTLSGNEFQNSQFSVFPNPANSYVTIISQGSDAKTICVFNVLGEKVIHTSLLGNRLDISSLESGIYIVKITQENITTSKKLVVE